MKNLFNILNNKKGALKIAVLSLAALIPSAASADPIPAPRNHPAGVAAVSDLQSIARSFAEDSYRICRENSPFANINAPEAKPERQSNAKADQILEYAKRFLGTRYVWGATGPNAFDCSGFTSYVFRHGGGVELQRTSRMQYTQGEKVSVNDLLPGDLLFFSSARSGRGQVGHVAIVADVDHEKGTCRFIHASTRRGVVYQNFPDNGYYSRNFVGAKRVIK